MQYGKIYHTSKEGVMNCIRLESINGEYHIVLTFLKELKVFSDPSDCRRFTEIMIEVMDKMDCKMLMQSIMLNHVHIIVQEGKGKKLSSIVISLCTRFAKYFNKKNNRKGRLFRERYYSSPINDEVYMFRLARYIAQNAMILKNVDKPWDYEWSSAKAYKNCKGRFFFPEVVERYEKNFRYHPYSLDELLGFEGDDKLEHFVNQVAHNDNKMTPPLSLEDFMNYPISEKMILKCDYRRYNDSDAYEIYINELTSLHIKDLKTHDDPWCRKKAIFRMRQIGLTLKQIRAFSGLTATDLRKAMFPTI
jgi:REP element-mobilizing transposase RayT